MYDKQMKGYREKDVVNNAMFKIEFPEIFKLAFRLE